MTSVHHIGPAGMDAADGQVAGLSLKKEFVKAWNVFVQ